jgi:hypothetical protein
LKYEPDIAGKEVKIKIQDAFIVAKLEIQNFLEKKWNNQVIVLGIKNIFVEDY